MPDKESIEIDVNEERSYEMNFFLLQFAHRHMDFQLAELQSILDMYNLLHLCEIHPLPNEQHPHLWERANSQQQSEEKAKYPFGPGISLTSYSKGVDEQKLKEFTMAPPNNDQKSSPVAQDVIKPPTKNRKGSISSTRSFLILSFPINFDNNKETDQGKLVLKAFTRCVLVRSVIELWGSAKDMRGCANGVKQYAMTSEPNGMKSKRSSLVQKYCIEGEKSWKLTIHTFGSKYSREEQSTMRSEFSFLPFTGAVKMVDPDDEYILIREIELDSLGSPLYPRHSHKKEVIPANDARPPLAVYFGRILLSGLREGKVDKFSLKKRKYLGPTSMDTELSMIMTNLGQVSKCKFPYTIQNSYSFMMLIPKGTPQSQVKKGSFCFDPFVGTGSILLTCALQGAYCFGTDIDIRVLRGKGSDQNIYANFKQV